MGDMTQVVYVYGIVRPGFDVGSVPTGLDDATVTVVNSGPVAAIVSRLPADTYNAAAVEEHSADVSWLSPRAMSHDRVLTWAQEHGGVIPLPMFSLWASDASLAKSLSTQAKELQRVFERVKGADEFGLRVHRRDSVMLKSISELDDELGQLGKEAKAAPPGQRYLLERKIAEQSKASVKAVSQRMAGEIFEGLRALSRDAISRPVLPKNEQVPDATMVLNGAFLVDPKRPDDFRAAVGARVRYFQPPG